MVRKILNILFWLTVLGGVIGDIWIATYVHLTL